MMYLTFFIKWKIGNQLNIHLVHLLFVSRWKWIYWWLICRGCKSEIYKIFFKL